MIRDMSVSHHNLANLTIEELFFLQVLVDVAREEWEKFDNHARYVQVLLLSQTRRQVSPFVYDRLRQLRKGPLLPALRELRIPPGYLGDLRCSFISLSDHLRLVELHNNCVSQPEFFLPFIPAVITEAPLLTHLILHTQADVNLERVSELKQLCKLDLRVPTWNLPNALIQKLGQLESLSDLRVELGAGNPSRRKLQTIVAEQFPIMANAYPKLQTLLIRGSVVAITQIMRVMSFTSLSTLTLGFNTMSSWDEVFKTLARKETHVSSVSLHSYLVQIHCEFDWISPLLQIHTLETLDIDTESFSICDDEFFTLMSSLQNLRRLSLPSWFQSTTLTAQVLWQPSKLAPRLEELKISLYQSAPLSPFLPTINISQRDAHLALRKLSISSAYRNMQDDDVIHLARVLYQAFPNLEIVEGFGPNSPCECWRRVDTFRNALVREDD